MQGIVMTSAPDFMAAATEEIRRRYPEAKLQVLGPGVFFLPSEQGDETNAELLKSPPVFLHHLHKAKVWQVQAAADLTASVKQALQADLPQVSPSLTLAIQAREVGKQMFDWQPRELKEQCDQVLLVAGYQSAIKDPDWVASVTVVGDKVFYGLSPAEHNLSNWSSGMIHFRKEASDISRAKFKLLEAIIRFRLDLPCGGRALDLGAAPGGWTSVLLEKGMSVVAIDTGELDPRLAKMPGLQFRQMNVKELRFKPSERFDLITCDMSWSPLFTVEMINRLKNNLRPGGQVIMTVKLMGKSVWPMIRRVLDALDDSFVVKHAQHLFHNRQEITLHLRKE